MCAQSCQTLCNPMDCNTPGSSVHGIFLRQEYWSGLPFLPPGDLPDPGMEAVFPTCPALAAGFFTTSAAWKAQYLILQCYSEPKGRLWVRCREIFRQLLVRDDMQCRAGLHWPRGERWRVKKMENECLFSSFEKRR